VVDMTDSEVHHPAQVVAVIGPPSMACFMQCEHHVPPTEKDLLRLTYNTIHIILTSKKKINMKTTNTVKIKSDIG